jgi:hypothetical protein
MGTGGRGSWWRGSLGREGRRERWRRREERNEVGVIHRAGGNKKQQSANDDDNRERGREAIEQQVREARQEG